MGTGYAKATYPLFTSYLLKLRNVVTTVLDRRRRAGYGGRAQEIVLHMTIDCIARLRVRDAARQGEVEIG